MDRKRSNSPMRLEEDSSQKRLRSHSNALKMQKKLTEMKGVGHFGVDLTDYVQTAMKQGGSLDDSSRHTAVGKIKSQGKAVGESIDDVVPSFMAKAIRKHVESKRTVSQLDMRIKPRDSHQYLGHMHSQSTVNPKHGDVPLSKDINEPLSPRPHDEMDGSLHRAHTNPFSLVGADSNKMNTVWAPSWANVTLDGAIEKQALRYANKGRPTIHFRLDTDDRSTVGFATTDKNKKVKSYSLQYKRK